MHEPGGGGEEVAEQDHDPVQLDQEAEQRPPEENEGDARGEGDGALELLPSREEGGRLLEPDYQGQAGEEEDLNEGRNGLVSGWLGIVMGGGCKRETSGEEKDLRFPSLA